MSILNRYLLIVLLMVVTNPSEPDVFVLSAPCNGAVSRDKEKKIMLLMIIPGFTVVTFVRNVIKSIFVSRDKRRSSILSAVKNFIFLFLLNFACFF
jgi:hypothetical protein